MRRVAESTSADAIRAAEVAGALCLATDLAMGFDWEHGLSATTSAMRLCDALGTDAATRQQAYYLSLLTYVGCTADAAEKAGIYGGPLTEQIVGVIWGGRSEMLRVVARMLPEPGASLPVAAAQTIARLPRALAHHPHEQLALCEVAQLMSRRLGLPEQVSQAFFYLTERWDGAGALRRGRGPELPLALRIALVARDGAYLAAAHGPEAAGRVIRERAGRAHDPVVAGALATHLGDVIGTGGPAGDPADAWADVLDAEPEPRIVLEGDGIAAALGAVGDFADLLSPSFAGHAAAVASLAGRAAASCGLPDDDVTRTHRSALVQDVGRVSVPGPVWSKAGPLTGHEWEQVRLHPYYSERILSRSATLRALGADAAGHHERPDGSGYHRGVGAEALSTRARIQAAADVLQALRERRPHRPALSLPDAVDVVAAEASAGRLDATAVAAVAEAAGAEPPAVQRPAGLTEREAEVVALLARGLATKQVARALGISPKTADRHVEHAYRKIGVSSRAAVTLFATQHGLTAWAESGSVG